MILRLPWSLANPLIISWYAKRKVRFYIPLHLSFLPIGYTEKSVSYGPVKGHSSEVCSPRRAAYVTLARPSFAHYSRTCKTTQPYTCNCNLTPLARKFPGMRPIGKMHMSVSDTAANHVTQASGPRLITPIFVLASLWSADDMLADRQSCHYFQMGLGCHSSRIRTLICT